MHSIVAKSILTTVLLLSFNTAHALSVIGQVKRSFVTNEHVYFWILRDDCKSQNLAGVKNTNWSNPNSSPASDKWFFLLNTSYNEGYQLLIRVDSCLPDLGQDIDHIVLDRKLP